MSGVLGLSTPWTRAALTGQRRQDVTALIPDGWTLGVSMSPNRGQWIFWTRDPEGHNSMRFRVSASMGLYDACLYALAHWKLVPRG